jgi:hydrogenase maturation protease
LRVFNNLKTLVVGLGNPILGDDGVGWKVAEELQKSGILPSDVDVICLALGGISLMEDLGLSESRSGSMRWT